MFMKRVYHLSVMASYVPLYLRVTALLHKCTYLQFTDENKLAGVDVIRYFLFWTLADVLYFPFEWVIGLVEC